MNQTASCTLVANPNFRKMFATCVSTVLREMKSWRAMVAFDAPSATRATTESSDVVSPANNGFGVTGLGTTGPGTTGPGTAGPDIAGLAGLGEKVIVFIKIDPFEVESMQTW